MTTLRWANLTLRFALELSVLAAAGYWGFRAADGLPAQIGLGLAVPLAIAVVWGVFGSPAAPLRLPLVPRTGLEIVVFGAGVLLLWAAAQPAIAIALGVMLVLNRVLMLILGGEPVRVRPSGRAP